MKDSGIEWCLDIPANWQVMPNKHVMHKVKNICDKYNGEDILSLTMNGVIVRDLDAGGKMPTTFDGYQKVVAGNLLMCLFDIDVTPRCIGLICNNGLTSPAYSQFEMHSNAYAPYYYYYYLMLDNTKELLHLAKNLRHSFTEEQLGGIMTPVPPLAEQQKIATFLDQKCKEVDELIALQEKMIEELKAYKQSVITETITKGLNPDVPMKDSGIEWIGQIPEHWDVLQVRRITKSHLQGYYDSDGYVESGYRLLRITDFQGDGKISVKDSPYVKETANIHAFVLQEGDFCFARTGGAGSFGYVSAIDEPTVFASYLIRFRFQQQDNEYLKFYYLSHCFANEIASLIHGGVNQNIHAENIKDAHLTIPPLDEQKQIADYLNALCPHIDELISIKQSKIAELQDYKKSLIYEYVTGKKEVK